MEIQQRYRPIRSGHSIVDCGAAPGSWSQYSSAVVGKRGRVYALDREPFSLPASYTNVVHIVGDIHGDTTLHYLKQHGPYHGVLSDAAPATTGNKTVDATRAYTLAVRIVSWLPHLLLPNGYIIIKCFWSEQCREFYSHLKHHFNNLHTQRVRATRSHSTEIYFVGLGYITDSSRNRDNAIPPPQP